MTFKLQETDREHWFLTAEVSLPKQNNGILIQEVLFPKQNTGLRFWEWHFRVVNIIVLFWENSCMAVKQRLAF
jgi:hypothetical protein